ncbi:MAG: Asp-tRNA(Asn)/Glu-tRNA(Gln) amidotransferase subunit GatA [Planctomycetota bacterium]
MAGTSLGRQLKAREIAHLVRGGELTAVQVLEEHYRRIDAAEPRIRAFLDLSRARAHADAERIDRQRRDGQARGRLLGVPIAIKDNICSMGELTTCASRILEGFRSTYDATVVSRIKAEGGVIVGKTNMDEFAMGSSTENSARQQTCNPWDLSRIPGGSSGGSAAAVAARVVPLALGSDTGGSIRQPAALTGTVGFKPTYGRVSRYGLVAFASSLDQIGPIAADVEDAALLFEVLAGADDRDSTCLPEPAPDVGSALKRPLRGMRIGRAREYLSAGIHPQIAQATEAALQALATEGAQIVDVSLPNTGAAIPAYYLVATSEASSNLARFDGVRYGPRAETPDLLGLYESTRHDGFGPEVRRRIMMGTYSLSAGYYDAYYAKALKVRRLIQNDFKSNFERVDALLVPTSPVCAFKLGEKLDPLQMYLCDIFTAPANLAGIPGASVPFALSSERLPIGLQVLCPALHDARTLQVAWALEQVAPARHEICPVAQELLPD